MQEDQQAFLDAGANSVMTKPASRAMLQKMITQWTHK